MRQHPDGRLYSASDLVNFLGCGHATVLDVRQLTEPVAFPPDSAQTVLLQEKGIEHERAFLAQLRAEGRNVIEIASEGPLEARVEWTLQAMRAGADVIYQGALLSRPWHGYSDFLLKVEGVPSALGDYAYDVADTKLSRTAKPKHVIQLCVYADLVAKVQGVAPGSLFVSLGNGVQARVGTSSVHHYYEIARRRFEAFAGAAERPRTTAEPCGHCTYCRWSEACQAEWERLEHLSLVAGMNRSQIAKLRASGIASIGHLADAPAGVVVPGLNADIFARLRAQAGLQQVRRRTGEDRVEVLPVRHGRGFERMPPPHPADLFFDMEGDPLFEGGLEYLFGFIDATAGPERFTPFWAHDRAAEKAAFEGAIDFIVAHLAANPGAHIYHYAAYEETALKRLAMYHGTRETEVDDILRRGQLVDLYRVVTEAIRTSEPGYSIKNLEAFYLEGGRGGEVKTAGDSIVVYEQWRRLGDQALLDEISAYNELDCRSTRLCRDWLLGLRPADVRWRHVGEALAPTPEKVAQRHEAEARTAALIDALMAGAAEPDRESRALLCQLLEFHRREAKPEWWAMFARREMEPQALLDDAACLAGVTADLERPPRPDKKSTIYAFTFPAQDFKLRVGDEVLRASTGEAAGTVMFIDEESRRLELKLGPSRTRLADGDSLIPEGPVGDKQLRDAVYRYAGAVSRGEGAYSAVTHILAGQAPRLAGRPDGAPIIGQGQDAVDGTIAALADIDGSYLLVQGPPGSGKTFTSAAAIAELLARGKTVGVASNSHKAINNLLAGVQAAADQKGVRFRGIKKSSREDQYVEACTCIENTTDNKRATDGGFNLIAGTAWLFARPELDQSLDYLFVDEAGQVSLANIIAMGVSARNIVLVGDQMQLAQPIQGAHPGRSGVSALDHLLGDVATVPDDRGIFLATTRRLHPDLCRFISDAVYDGRLISHDSACGQALIVPAGVEDPALGRAGLRFVDVFHDGCAQRSAEEGQRLKATYQALLGCEWVNQKGETAPISVDEILVVSPYNMQVELLRSLLPPGVRVGTVDRFQGQEAAVVLISMATSSGDDLPRQIEFLYSRNRLNVAVSRARCLAVIFANPRLLEISCGTVEQMQLVNTLCWAKLYASEGLNLSAADG
jgi:uncharacterized protein